jgi:hypothetical protein
MDPGSAFLLLLPSCLFDLKAKAKEQRSKSKRTSLSLSAHDPAWLAASNLPMHTQQHKQHTATNERNS